MQGRGEHICVFDRTPQSSHSLDFSFLFTFFPSLFLSFCLYFFLPPALSLSLSLSPSLPPSLFPRWRHVDQGCEWSNPMQLGLLHFPWCGLLCPGLFRAIRARLRRASMHGETAFESLERKPKNRKEMVVFHVVPIWQLILHRSYDRIQKWLTVFVFRRTVTKNTMTIHDLHTSPTSMMDACPGSIMVADTADFSFWNRTVVSLIQLPLPCVLKEIYCNILYVVSYVSS